MSPPPNLKVPTMTADPARIATLRRASGAISAAEHALAAAGIAPGCLTSLQDRVGRALIDAGWRAPAAADASRNKLESVRSDHGAERLPAPDRDPHLTALAAADGRAPRRWVRVPGEGWRVEV